MMIPERNHRGAISEDDRHQRNVPNLIVNTCDGSRHSLRLSWPLQVRYVTLGQTRDRDRFFPADSC